jgi:transcriptional regulator with XRE-family HTH domain
METGNNPTGEVMRELRQKRGLTQKQFGQMLDVDAGYISLMENGRRKLPPALIAKLRTLMEEEPFAPTALDSAQVLLAEMTAARQEMGKPITAEEAAALAEMDPEALMTQSILLREALEVQASRELLAGAKAFRKKRESARDSR